MIKTAVNTLGQPTMHISLHSLGSIQQTQDKSIKILDFTFNNKRDSSAKLENAYFCWSQAPKREDLKEKT